MRLFLKTLATAIIFVSACTQAQSNTNDNNTTEQTLHYPTRKTATNQISLLPETTGTNTDEFPTVPLMRTLNNGTTEEKEKALLIIRQHQNLAIAPLYYLGAKFLFSKGEKDKACFWALCGQIRSRYDASIASNPSCAKAVIALQMTAGAKVAEYQIENPESVATNLTKVLKWDKTIPHNYNPAWILHYQTNEKTDLPPFKPQNQWPNIAEGNRIDFQQQVNHNIKLMQNPATKDAFLTMLKLNTKQNQALIHGTKFELSQEEKKQQTEALKIIETLEKDTIE